MNPGADGVTLTVEFDITTGGAVLLDGMSGCAFGLVADKHDVVPYITQHGLEVVDHPAGVTHAAAGNHHGRPALHMPLPVITTAGWRVLTSRLSIRWCWA